MSLIRRGGILCAAAVPLLGAGALAGAAPAGAAPATTRPATLATQAAPPTARTGTSAPTGTGTTAPTGPSGAPCPAGAGVTVVVQRGADAVVGCAAGDPSSGLDALRRAGFTVTPVQSSPGAVCRIDGEPAGDPCVAMPPATAYWSYWHAMPGGTWTFAQTGAASADPAPGTVEGWRFGAGTPPGIAPPRAPGPAASAAGDPPGTPPETPAGAAPDGTGGTAAGEGTAADTGGGWGRLGLAGGLLLVLGAAGTTAALRRRRS